MSDEEYKAAVGRMYTHPEGGRIGVPKTYPGKFGSPTVETATVPQRIADLAKRVTEAGHELHLARAQHVEALVRKSQSEGMFNELANELVELIAEHREGPPSDGQAHEREASDA